MIEFIAYATPLEYKIRQIKPKMEFGLVREIARSVNRCVNVNNNLLLAIIRTESDFRVGAFNGADYGLMQINEYHVRRRKLSTKRLLTEADYNIRVGCEVLGWLLKRYETWEAVGRYNCGTKRECVGWKSVKEYVRRVRAFKVEFDGMDGSGQ